MSRLVESLRRRGRSEDGQALILMAIAMIVLLLMVGFVFDMGRVYLAQRQLQDAVDASALVAGQNLPNSSTAYTKALYYAASGTKNPLSDWDATAAAPKVTFECISEGPNYTAGSPPTCTSDTSGDNCSPAGQATYPAGETTCNAVSVTETATVGSTFLSWLIPQFNVSATSTASQRGGSPVNAVVVLDTTGSMSTNADTSCSSSIGVSNPSRLDCAKAGIRALLQALKPCSSTVSCSTSGSTTIDQVAMMVFPAGDPMNTSYEQNDCNASHTFPVVYPKWYSYTYDATQTNGGIPTTDQQSGYLAVPLEDTYKTSANTNATLVSTDPIVESVSWTHSCSGGSYPSTDRYGEADYYGLKDNNALTNGAEGTNSYTAGAITEAQNYLNSQSTPGTANVIILVSDGEFNSPANSGWTTNTECADAVNAAAQAKLAGTTIYTLGYGSSGAPNSCGPDSPSDTYTTDTTVLKKIATSSADYYNNANGATLITNFATIGSVLGNPRLVPDCPSSGTC